MTKLETATANQSKVADKSVLTEHGQAAVMLQDFGLSESETAVYIALLEAGRELGGSEIAQRAAIPRQYVYAALPSLREKGLVIEIPKGKQSRYRAAPEIEIEKIAKRKLVAAETLVRELGTISRIGHEQDAEVFIGKEAILRHQLDWVKHAPVGTEQYLLGGSGQAMRELFGSELRHNTRLQGKKKFTTLYLCGREEEKLFHDYTEHGVNLRIRSLSIIPDLLPTIAIRGDTVEIHSYFNPPIMYVIKSQPVAEKFKTFFLGLWEMAGEGK